jgi:asparagine N-glycosylation enzyme membrane subunit Stt3
MMGTWKLHGNFFKLGPQKGLYKRRTPYYFQFAQHHFKVWFCTITLFVLFHVHAFIYYHIKILFKQVFALHILCSYLLFWFYIIGFRFRPPFAIVYLGHCVVVTYVQFDSNIRVLYVFLGFFKNMAQNTHSDKGYAKNLYRAAKTAVC